MGRDDVSPVLPVIDTISQAQRALLRAAVSSPPTKVTPFRVVSVRSPGARSAWAFRDAKMLVIQVVAGAE